MKKSILFSLAAAMFGASAQANVSKQSKHEINPPPEVDQMDSNFFLRTSNGPIFHPTKSQKIKNKVNRLRRGIKK
jgi:hypothetical protein